jgi:hypothetical protein
MRGAEHDFYELHTAMLSLLCASSLTMSLTALRAPRGHARSPPDELALTMRNTAEYHRGQRNAAGLGRGGAGDESMSGKMQAASEPRL